MLFLGVWQVGVMVLFYFYQFDWYFVFIEWQFYYGYDWYVGQISFLGGKFEDLDVLLEEMALWEIEEEVGVFVDIIEVLGKLMELYILVSNFQVYFYVGFMDSCLVFVLDVEEVCIILEVLFSYLFNFVI